MKDKVINPFLASIKALLGNGKTNQRFNDITQNDLSKVLLKGGWDQAHNAHFFKRLFDPSRGGSRGIYTMRDFAQVLQNGFQFGPDKWVHLASRSVLIANFKNQRFVTFLVLGDEDNFWKELAGESPQGSFKRNMADAKRTTEGKK